MGCDNHIDATTIRRLVRRYVRGQYVCEQFLLFSWVSDVVVKTHAGYWHEYDCKATMEELKAAFWNEKRKCVLENGYREFKGQKIPTKRPNYVTVAIPRSIYDDAVVMLPKSVGIIVIGDDNRLECVRPSRKFHSHKYTDSELFLLDKFYAFYARWQEMVKQNKKDSE